MRFAVVNLGCKVNRVESDGIIAQLEACGLQRTEDDPHMVIINTCTVTGEAEKKTRKAVHRALAMYPGAQIVVTGCAAAIDPQEFTQMDERVRVVGKPAVVEFCRAREGAGTDAEAGRSSLRDCSEWIGDGSASLRVGTGFPSRVGVKVQDGCDNACTYCIVHVARGRATSRPAQECLEEARDLALAGVREIVLTGINIGSYRDGDLHIAGLMRMMREACPDMRLRLSSIEPRDVDDDLIDLLASSEGMVCRHLHLPLQSGSTKVLAQMARPYDAAYYADLVQRLYRSVPQLSLSTDIIVGFPGETEQDFLETLAMCRACKFSKVHVFRYSKREGTPAARRVDQVDPQVAAERAQRLTTLAHALRQTGGRKRVGAEELVLVEADGQGMSESYYPVRFSTDAVPGDLMRCTFTEFDKDGIFSV